MPLDLPVVNPAPPRKARADALRNRERILCAARELIESRGLEAISMDDVAVQAGVGKGTLYRRFGDKGGLVRSLLEPVERELQDTVIRGAPPLGPGAPPGERLHAFGDALLDQVERHGELWMAIETNNPGARFRDPVRQFQCTHIAVLLREALGPAAPAQYLADALMAPLSGEQYLHHARGRGMSADELRAGWHTLAEAILCLGDQPPSASRATAR